MEETNGDGTATVSVAPVVAAVESGSTHNTATALDPSGIGRRVEQEVNALLEAAQVEADRIRAKAIAGIRMAEAKVTALQQQMATTLAQLSELAERIEPGKPAERQSLAERFAANGSRPAERVTNGSTPAQPEASVFDPPPAKDEKPATGIPPSEEIVRILREHLT
jgi:cell division septum initiation protein DivIVA